jgi:hypothetical protein
MNNSKNTKRSSKNVKTKNNKINKKTINDTDVKSESSETPSLPEKPTNLSMYYNATSRYPFISHKELTKYESFIIDFRKKGAYYKGVETPAKAQEYEDELNIDDGKFIFLNKFIPIMKDKYGKYLREILLTPNGNKTKSGAKILDVKVKVFQKYLKSFDTTHILNVYIYKGYIFKSKKTGNYYLSIYYGKNLTAEYY